MVRMEQCSLYLFNQSGYLKMFSHIVGDIPGTGGLIFKFNILIIEFCDIKLIVSCRIYMLFFVFLWF